jgi:uncharacterized membrane protein YhaH (DUF805 family)
MNFGDAVSTCLKKYVTFEGRARRSEYWWFVLAVFLASLVLSLISSILGGLVNLAMLLPLLAVGVRRLHDLGKSGWWLLIGLIPLIGGLVLLYFYVQPGDAGSNDFGDAPAAS